MRKIFLRLMHTLVDLYYSRLSHLKTIMVNNQNIPITKASLSSPFISYQGGLPAV